MALWTCDACPYYNSFTDQVQLVVSHDDRRMVGGVWWKDGWRVALLWTSIAVILFIIFVTILLCISRVCPSLTCCAWMTANKEPKGRISRTPGSVTRRGYRDEGVNRRIMVILIRR